MAWKTPAECAAGIRRAPTRGDRGAVVDGDDAERRAMLETRAEARSRISRPAAVW